MKNNQYVITDHVNMFEELEYYIQLNNGTIIAGPFPLPQDAKMALLELLGEPGSVAAEQVYKDGRRYWK